MNDAPRTMKKAANSRRTRNVSIGVDAQAASHSHTFQNTVGDRAMLETFET